MRRQREDKVAVLVGRELLDELWANVMAYDSRLQNLPKDEAQENNTIMVEYTIKRYLKEKEIGPKKMDEPNPGKYFYDHTYHRRR